MDNQAIKPRRWHWLMAPMYRLRPDALKVLAVAFAVGICGVSAPVHAEAPAEAMVLSGTQKSYRPLINLAPSGMTLAAYAHVATRLESHTGFEVGDGEQNLDSGADLNLLSRMGVLLHSGQTLLPFFIKMTVEGDVLSGMLTPAPNLEGVGIPGSEGYHHDFRKVALTASYGGWFGIKAGLFTTHWGLGLLTNDGQHGWRPGSAAFSDPRDGDRVLRGMLFTGPLGDELMMAGLSFDRVWKDDQIREGDDAYQITGYFQMGQVQSHRGGIYAYRRTQRSKDGRESQLTALDLFLSSAFELGDSARLRLGGEVAVKVGDERIDENHENVMDMRQFGAAIQAKLDLGSYGFVLDAFFASGDDDPEDGFLGAFQAHRSYEQGLLLYRHVMAAERGVSPQTDPGASLLAARELANRPTFGRITDTLAVFPRAWWRPLAGLEIYGGPLIAFSDSHDGTASETASTADGASYLGTELDLGLRWRALIHGMQLDLACEFGAFFPHQESAANAIATTEPVLGGRLMLHYRL